MRAQCCICADLFENTGNLNIAAVPCGHTFHEECLMRWLANSSTCPSCRKQVKKNQIIKRLFFDIPEVDEETPEDPDALHNQISSLKAQICSFGTLKRELTEVQDKLAASVASKEEVREQLKKVEKDKGILERHLTFVGEENSSYKRDLVDYDATKKKLKMLENIQLMLQGSETDVSEMVNIHSDGGDGAIKQLSSMVVVVKREYSRTLEDKKALRNENRELNLQVILAQAKMAEMRKELKKIHLQLKESNKTVFDLERENNHNRRKVVHLRNALKRNKTEGSQSFVAAVNEDSPNVAYTPPPPPPPKLSPAKLLQAPNCDGRDQNKNVNNDGNSKSGPQRGEECLSPDLFDKDDETDNNDKGQKFRKRVSSDLKDNRVCDVDSDTEKNDFYASAPSVLKMIRISSAAEKFKAAKLRKVEMEKDSAPSIPYANFSIMQKKLTGLSSSRPLALLNSDTGLSKSRSYNGLGGSTKIEEPFETPIRGTARHYQLMKKKGSKKRCPLASKPIPNQPNLKSFIPNMSSSPSISLSGSSDNGDKFNSSGNSACVIISPIDSSSSSKTNSYKRAESNQSRVNNMFAKSADTAAKKLKKTASTSSKGAGSSNISLHLDRPANDIIDLT